jgi:hypothetical protein
MWGLTVGVSSGSKLARRASVNGGVAAATVDVDLSEACIYEASDPGCSVIVLGLFGSGNTYDANAST